MLRETKSPINQNFGENATNMYAKLGMKGHDGTDFACRTGTDIYFGRDKGLVYKITNFPNSGLCISIITKENGVIHRHLYCHLLKVYCSEGEVVEKGDLIAITNNSGLYTTGSHLHRGLYEEERVENNRNFEYIDKNKDNGYFGAIPIEWDDEFVLDTLDRSALIKIIWKTMIKKLIYK